MFHNKQEMITLTAGDMAENHKGMEQIGTMVPEGEGYHKDDFDTIYHTLDDYKINCDMYDLTDGIPCVTEMGISAYVMVIPDGINKIFANECILHNGIVSTHKDMMDEQKSLEYDKHAFMYGRVVKKHARWNLCFDDESREPDYATGKGRLIGYNEVPLMKTLLDLFPKYFGEKAKNLKVESNYYYDVSKCGIGFHGDSERRKVIAMRLGDASLPMYYQWFHNGESQGERIRVKLNPGDIYIMCEKSVGTDWKKKRVPTLRHATGCDKFTV